MENEELFAREPEVDAHVRARKTRRAEDVTENTPLIDGTDELLYRQPSHADDDRPRWRRPSVSEEKVGADF